MAVACLPCSTALFRSSTALAASKRPRRHRARLVRHSAGRRGGDGLLGGRHGLLDVRRGTGLLGLQPHRGSDLAEAAELSRQAVECAPAGSAQQAMFLARRCLIMVTSFARTRDRSDLDQAVELASRQLTSPTLGISSARCT